MAAASGLTGRLRRLLADAGRFSVVGVVGYALDIAVFNALRIAGPGPLREPLLAKTAGVAAATVLAWLGSRYWTFRHHRRSDTGREIVEFTLVSVAGYLINTLVLYLAHYVLGLRSVVADNVSGNVVGAGLGAVARFLAYRYWVYRPSRSARAHEVAAASPPDPEAERLVADPADCKPLDGPGR